ncbi:hypothetical protein I600_335 [Maribacter dokdonensis DSW-8]|nr:hypothetical protein I600_335 [Maribacter dokdonensis DSW-8]
MILGVGVRLFGESISCYKLELTETETYDGGLVFNTYSINYNLLKQNSPENQVIFWTIN